MSQKPLSSAVWAPLSCADAGGASNVAPRAAAINVLVIVLIMFSLIITKTVSKKTEERSCP
ncbi:hypothetical protein GCM10011385_34920 [Nitratireductor aestuarii]|uniref:Uncharacterized protein n=1 Tax=Nitratireductor aestuarii TaxID=1735103 RepID=A0A916S264_9HYPH|nr:hypothetical protein GCM10011385_34920 [Nitratireductor aestuarii]